MIWKPFATCFSAAWLLTTAGMADAADNPAWVEQFAFWAAPELRAQARVIANFKEQLTTLPVIAAVNSGNRTGFQSAGITEGQDLWVEVELANTVPVDRVVLVPLLARGASGEVSGFGFPKRFLLEGIAGDGESQFLMDQRSSDYANPGLYPVSAICPPGTRLRKVRLTATAPWKSTGPPVLALSEILILQGNRSMTLKARVTSSSSREIPPTWARSNLVDMMTPLGLPLVPGGSGVLGWHGVVSRSGKERQSVTVDLGKDYHLDEIRMMPAWKRSMAWDSYYGFPSRFLIEGSIDEPFSKPIVIHDQTKSSLLSPGQNYQRFAAPDSPMRYLRVTATRLRDRTGDFTFALGELQAFSGNVNVALGAAVSAPKSMVNRDWTLAGLTDGQARGGVIIELSEWIDQLDQRKSLERQLEESVLRRSQLFIRTEHTLVATSVGGAGGIVLLAALGSWRGHRRRVLDRERHRERLARDLHDELGSNLGSIALISSLAGQEGPEQMRLDLAEIEEVARESADSMRDMVSLLGARRGKGHTDWLKVLDGLAERLLRGVELDCRLPTSPLVWEPNIETRREIYLFCKEVLHNAARHGHPIHLKFHLGPTADGLRVEISDDGCGFDDSQASSGHGLGNLRERATMMRAEMTITTSPGTGTRVLLAVPRGRRWIKVR